MHLRPALGALLVLLASSACDGGATEPSQSPEPSAVLEGQALAGPVCPVERDPPDPECAPRPVDGALVLIFAADESEVAAIRTDDEGRFSHSLPPGEYRIEAQPVEGYMGTPGPVEVTLAGGGRVSVELAYDTGIR